MLRLAYDGMKYAPKMVIQDIGLELGIMLHGRYTLKEYLSIGQTSLLYLAYDEQEKRKVAVKEFCPYAYANRDLNRKSVVCKSEKYHTQFLKMLQAFERECEILKSLTNQLLGKQASVVAWKDSFAANETRYLVMEYIEGIDLNQALEVGAIKNYKATIRQIIRMVQTVHKAGILHLDLKPSNIYMDKKGGLKLIDFGSARYLSDAEQEFSFATMGYSAPELFSGEKVSRASDIYSLGAIIYYFTTGHIPDNSKERLVEDRLPSISEYVTVPAILEQNIMKCLALKPEQRLRNLSFLGFLLL